MKVLKKKEATIKKDSPLYKVTQKHLNETLHTTQRIELSVYGYGVTTLDGEDNVGYLLKVERPPLTKRKHRNSLYKGLDAGYWQTYGWLFVGNMIGYTSGKTMKEVMEKVNEEYLNRCY